jgi:nitroreductase
MPLHHPMGRVGKLKTRVQRLRGSQMTLISAACGERHSKFVSFASLCAMRAAIRFIHTPRHRRIDLSLRAPTPLQRFPTNAIFMKDVLDVRHLHHVPPSRHPGVAGISTAHDPRALSAEYATKDERVNGLTALENIQLAPSALSLGMVWVARYTAATMHRLARGGKLHVRSMYEFPRTSRSARAAEPKCAERIA